MYRKRRGRLTTGFTGEGGEERGGCLGSLFSFVQSTASLHTEERLAGAASIRDEASMGLTAACQYPSKDGPLDG